MRFRLMMLIVASLVAGEAALSENPASAGPMEDAVKAYAKGDYANALPLWRTLADQGLPFAQYNLALMYERGQGTSQSYEEAAKWYQKAADQGDADSQFSLGLLYDSGKGVGQDLLQAYKWLSLSIDGFSDYQQKAQQQAARQRRDAVAARMTTDQIIAAGHLARAWKPQK